MAVQTVLVAAAFTAPSVLAHSTVSAADRSQTLIYGRPSVVTTLDPVHADASQTNIPDALLYDRLVTYNNHANVVGRLATTFKVAPDAKSIHITLRDGVKFHDGTALTAKDVQFTLDRSKRLGLGVASYIRGYVSTYVTNRLNFVITLDSPNTSFLGGLSKIWILNSKLMTANAGSDDGQAWLFGHDAGSGPYVLSANYDAANIHMDLFQQYWGNLAHRPAAIEIRQVGNSATAAALVRTGEIDLATGLTAGDGAALKSESTVTVVAYANLIMAVMWMNMNSGPTANLAVRQAIQDSFDYKNALIGIRAGNGIPMKKGILPAGFVCQPTLTQPHFDLDAAKALLAKAGIQNLQITMKYQPNQLEQKLEATLLQSNLKQIGVTLNLEPTTFPEWLASLQSFDTIPSMFLLTDAAPFPDPGVTLDITYNSKSVGSNRTGYSNPKVDQLLNQARQTPDEKARCDLYKEAQTLIFRDAPGVYMYTTASPAAYVTSRLTGIAPSSTVPQIDLANIRLKK